MKSAWRRGRGQGPGTAQNVPSLVTQEDREGHTGPAHLQQRALQQPASTQALLMASPSTHAPRVGTPQRGLGYPLHWGPKEES